MVHVPKASMLNNHPAYRWWRVSFALILTTWVAGCVTPVDYGPVRHSDYVTAARCSPEAAPDSRFSDKPFFLVTSRLPDCRSDNISLLQHRGDRVRYGRFAAPTTRENAKGKTVNTIPVTLSNEQQWWSDLTTAMTAKNGRVLVYVHGYRETFYTSAKDAAQIARLTELDVPVVHYSWPSQGQVLKYVTDETNMYWDQRNFRRFLTDLAKDAATKEIILVSHSLGARLVIPAVEYVDRSTATSDSSNISNIILASPDVDRQDFERDIADEVLSMKRVNKDRRITIYASAKDRALDLSYGIHGYPRLGRPDCFDPFDAADLKNAGEPVRCYASKSKYDVAPEKSGLYIVDTTEVSGDRAGHTDYLKSASACRDFAAVVKGNRDGAGGRQQTRLSYVFTLAQPREGKDVDNFAVCGRR